MVGDVKRGHTPQGLSCSGLYAKKSGFRNHGPVGTGYGRNVCPVSFNSASRQQRVSQDIYQY